MPWALPEKARKKNKLFTTANSSVHQMDKEDVR